MLSNSFCLVNIFKQGFDTDADARCIDAELVKSDDQALQVVLAFA